MARVLAFVADAIFLRALRADGALLATAVTCDVLTSPAYTTSSATSCTTTTASIASAASTSTSPIAGYFSLSSLRLMRLPAYFPSGISLLKLVVDISKLRF